MLRTFGDPPVFAEATGAWPPRVVALHGWGRERHDFDTALAGLDAMALDLPGFGMSAPPSEAWGTARYADRVAEVLDEVDASPLTVVGHSFGGRVGVRLAAARPDLVSALVLTGAPIAPSGRPRRRPPLAYRLVRAAARRGLVSEGRLEAARVKHGSPDYAAASGVMRGVLVTTLAEDYAEDLSALACPVTLVWGEQDAEVPVVVADVAAERIGDARVVRVPGVGHGLPWEAPQALRAAIDEAMA